MHKHNLIRFVVLEEKVGEEGIHAVGVDLLARLLLTFY
jgi:hypothetical protein